MGREDNSTEAVQMVRRLCGEIKLFDLCDLARCRFRDGKYCTDPDVLARFESIADEEDSVPGPTVFVDEGDDDYPLDDDDDDESFRFGGSDSYGDSEENENLGED